MNAVEVQIIVIAKQPLPGKVKTRLSPPYTPAQAAAIAAASLADTIETVSRTPAAWRVLLLDGGYDAPPGWHVVPQRGDGLGQRLANGLCDVAGGGPCLLIGMDTPQVSPALLQDVADGLSTADAVLGPAVDGGWWALAIRDPRTAAVLATVAMSQHNTGKLTAEAFERQGLSVSQAAVLQDIDTAGDLHEVARLCPGSQIAAAVSALEPA